MRRWTMLAMGVLCLSAGYAVAQRSDAPEQGKVNPLTELLRVGRLMGRVKDIDLTIRKLALEVETEESAEPVIVIFLLNEKTRVRKVEKVKALSDITKGNPLLILFAPPKEGDLPTATFIRILDDADWRPGRRRTGPN